MTEGHVFYGVTFDHESFILRKSHSGHFKRKVYFKNIHGLKLVTSVKLFIGNMNVYLKNLRKSREKLLETIIKNLNEVTATVNGIQKLITLYVKIISMIR